MSDTNNQETYFEQLPVEVRVGIYEMLPYPDLLNMRLISRTVKKEVDEHMNFHLKFDQSNSGKMKRLLLQRIKSCHIVYFPKRLNYTSKVFTHPKRVKKLMFDGLISKANLLKVLNQCPSVEQLIFTHETLGIEGLIEANRFDVCLQHLNSLTHLNLQMLRYPLGDPFESQENIEAFLRATFPNLCSFRLYFSLWGNFSSLLKFLVRHCEHLQELELQVGDRGDSKYTERYLKTSPLRISDNERKHLESLNLTKFCYRDDVLNLNGVVEELIMSILLKQRHLKVLQFYSPGELSWSTLRAIVLANERTLKEVVVYNVQSTPNEPRRENNNAALQVPQITADMSMFTKCSQLKTLALSCTSSNGNDPNVVGTVVMKMNNLHCISSSIESLHLTGFTLDGQELVNLTNIGDNRLKEVLLADAGTMRYSDVLTCFLKNCRNLCYLNVRPVVLQAANEQVWYKEIRKLSKLYERFMGIPYDPIDDLEGFEANIREEDKDWLKSCETTLSVYSNSGS
ncbi:unnamed protein product [Orchesella dallaii]|uniref:F-box domain-containing protein n=1 Tax=Orchesella dallaii TaxID=48710 RepID=A0ABP1RTX3_9HEXA